MAADGNKGFDNLIGTHTEALEENSLMIANLLEALNKKAKSKRSKDKMTSKDVKDLKAIQRTLNNINNEIDRL